MKPSDQLIFKLLPHIEDQEKFQQYILIFSEQKINTFYQRIVASDYKEEIVLAQYSKATYKNYKTILKSLTTDYLSTTKLKDVKAKQLRRVLDIADLYTILNVPLFEELDKELDNALEKTDNDAYINIRTMFWGLKLQNVHRLHINSYDRIIKLSEEYLNTVTINHDNINLYLIQLKASLLFTTKSTIRTQQDADEVAYYIKELSKIEKANHVKTHSQQLYYLQASVSLKLLSGKYKSAYSEQLKLVEEVNNLTFPNEKLRQYQLGEQIANAYLYGIKANVDIDKKYLAHLEKQLDPKDNIVNSLLLLIDLFQKQAQKTIQLSDLKSFEKSINANQASMFAMHVSFIAATEYVTREMWQEANDLLSDINSEAPSFKVLTGIQEASILLKSVCLYELFQENNDKEYEPFCSYAEFAYNRFRKNKEEYPIELVVMKQLLKIKPLSSIEKKIDIFKKMKTTISTTINKYSEIYWTNYKFYFDFDKWINSYTKK